MKKRPDSNKSLPNYTINGKPVLMESSLSSKQPLKKLSRASVVSVTFVSKKMKRIIPNGELKF
jgi:hypothetical protein